MRGQGSLKIGIENLYTIEPLTENQKLFFKEWKKFPIYVLSGFAGTGKTFIAMYKALEDVLGSHRYKKLIILRSAVPTRDLGAMPGDLEEKGSVYDEICNSLFNKKESYLRLKEQGRIAFSLTSYIRGITFDESIIIVDEIENLTYHELYSVITRVGEGSKIVFCGDFRQSDEKFNGMTKFLRVLARMKNMVYNIDFTKDDIVRSNLVKEFIIASSEEE